MPIFDKPFTILATPQVIADYLVTHVPTDGRLFFAKESSLYVITYGDIGLVYLIRPAFVSTDNVRLIAADTPSIKHAFQATSLKETVQQIISSPTPIDVSPTAQDLINRQINALVKPFSPGAAPTATPPPAKPSLSVPRRATELPDLTILKPAKPPKPTWGIVGVLLLAAIFVIIVGIGIFAYRVLIVSQFTNAGNLINSSINPQTVALNPDGTWQEVNTFAVPECSQLSITGFTCYRALQTNLGAVEALLGGVPSTGPIDLGQVEQDSFGNLQTKEPSLQRLRTYYLKIGDKKIEAIRREMNYPVRNTDLKRYEVQYYFGYKGVLYELTIYSPGKAIFDLNSQRITDLVNGITFNLGNSFENLTLFRRSKI